MKSRRSGFTLTESLVVIAILLLAGFILVPALGVAREQSKQSVCQAQLFQIGKAALIYTDDNDGELPTQGLRSDGTPAVSYLDNQSCCNFYSYWDTFYGPYAGPAEFGHLYLSGLLVNESDMVFCPSFHGAALGVYSGNPSSWGSEFNSYNAKGDPAHWNYCGVGGTYRMLPEDEAKIGWLNNRLSYGFRPMYNMDINNLSQTNSTMSYISDLWEASPYANSFYRINIEEVSHVNRSSTEAELNAWYFDGHIEQRTFQRNKYFVSYSNLSGYPNGFTNIYPTITWSVLFEDAPYDFSLAQ